MAAMKTHRITRGHLRNRGADAWQCQYVVDGQPGTFTVHAKLKRDAWVLAEAEKLRRLEAVDAPFTIGALLERWLAAVLPTLPAQRTREQYRYVVRHYLTPLAAKPATGAGCLTSSDVTNWIASSLEQYAPASVVQHFRVLKQALRWAMDHQPEPLIPVNVAARLRPPSIPARYAPVFTWSEGLRLLDATRPPLKCLIALGMLGLRRGEALGVKRGKDGVDLENRILHIRQQIIYNGGRSKIRTQPPKRGSARDVGISAWIEPILREQIEISLTHHNVTDLLIVSPVGDKALDPSRVHKYLAEACRLAGIEQGDRTFHSLRHCYAVEMRQAGVSDMDIAHSLGHKNTLQLIRNYGNHPDENRYARMANVLDRITAEATSEGENREAQ